jgi:DNA-binding IclR family transcriptional regulator
MPTNATTRVVAVLDALLRAPDGTVGVRDLAAQLAMSRSATHRFLVVLADLGYARTIEGGRYQATARARAWSHFMWTRHPVLVEAQPVLAELADATGESVHLLLGTPTPSLGVFVARAAGRNPVQYQVPLGTLTPLTAGAAGKALLASRPEVVIDEVLRELSRTNPARSKDLAAELSDIAANGHATSTGELISDVVGVAAPFTRFNRDFGSVTVSTPTYRYNPKNAKLPRQVMAAAAKLSAQLGSSPDP